MAGRASTLWRYLELLPVQNPAQIVMLGEGFTRLRELGVRHLLDMTNTTLNMMNDLVATVIASRLKGAIQVEQGAIVSGEAVAATG